MTWASSHPGSTWLASLPVVQDDERDHLEMRATLLRATGDRVRVLVSAVVLGLDPDDVVEVEPVDSDPRPGAEALPVWLTLRRGSRLLSTDDGSAVSELVTTGNRPFSVAMRPSRPRGYSSGRFHELEADFLERRGLVPWE